MEDLAWKAAGKQQGKTTAAIVPKIGEEKIRKFAARQDEKFAFRTHSFWLDSPVNLGDSLDLREVDDGLEAPRVLRVGIR